MKLFRQPASFLGALLLMSCIAVGGAAAQPQTTMPSPAGAEAPEPTRSNFVEPIQRARPSVVTIYTRQTVNTEGFRLPGRPRPRGPARRRGRSQSMIGLGSGVVVRSDGFILTNEHVVGKAEEIGVILSDGSMEPARVVGVDPKADLAVVRVDRTNLPRIEFADSNELRAGQWAIAIGSPYGLNNTVTLGIVSTVHRRIGALPVEDFVQVDAAINQGNSGGPLIDEAGRLIGINTMIESLSGGNEGIGFAVSSRLAHRTARDLIQYGEARRPVLGVTLQNLPTNVLRERYGTDHGVLIGSVKKKTPAARAGLEDGDLLLEYGGDPVEEAHQVSRNTWQRAPGDTVTLVYQRKGGRHATRVQLADE